MKGFDHLNIEQLRLELKKRIKILDNRIEIRSGNNFHNEEDRIKHFHSEAYAYEEVLNLINGGIKK